MSQWISDSVNRLRESDTLVRNSWRHAEYSYFPNEAVAAAAVDEAADAPDNAGDSFGGRQKKKQKKE